MYSGMPVFLYFGDFGCEGTGCSAICGGIPMLSVVPAPFVRQIRLSQVPWLLLGLGALADGSDAAS